MVNVKLVAVEQSGSKILAERNGLNDGGVPFRSLFRCSNWLLVDSFVPVLVRSLNYNWVIERRCKNVSDSCRARRQASAIPLSLSLMICRQQAEVF